MKKLWYVLLISITLFFCPGLSACAESVGNETAGASHGTLDLAARDFGNDGIISLDGQWEFYWDKFLSYDDLITAPPDLYAEIPSSWTMYTLNGTNLPAEGYATYRLHVISGLPEGTQLGLCLGNFSSAYNLYVDGNLIASTGHVADNTAEEVGAFRSQDVFFRLPASEFDIIIQVSNHEFAKGGFWNSLYIGSAENIEDLSNYIVEKEIFLMGVLVIVALFQLAIYLIKTEFKFYLYSSCLYLSAAVMIDTVGTNMITGAIPWLSLKTVIFLWYFSSNWVPFFLMLVTHELFKSKFSGIAVQVYFFISLALQIFFIFRMIAKLRAVIGS